MVTKERVFFITYAIACLSLTAYGALALLNPGLLLESFTLHVYRFPAEAVSAEAYLSALYRLLGLFNIVPGVLGLILLRQYSLTRQGWIRKALLASALPAYAGPIIFDNTVGSIGPFEIIEHVLFAAMIISALLVLANSARIQVTGRPGGGTP